MSTPTPRTDAAVTLTFAAGHNTVCPNFARTLERELADQAARFHDEIVRRQGIVRDNHELNLKERDQLRTALAAERARLDWLLQDDVTRFDVSYHDRAAIDTAMKEDDK